MTGYQAGLEFVLLSLNVAQKVTELMANAKAQGLEGIPDEALAELKAEREAAEQAFLNANAQ